MQNAERGGGDLPRCFHKNSSAFKNEWISGDLPLDSKKDVWTGLSDGLKSYLSKSVASIILFNGDKILFSCSGLAMEHQLTKFLTTATLARALNATTKHHRDLKIRARLDGTKLYDGYITGHDLDRDFAVVEVCHVPDVQVGPFQSALESLPHGEVLAVGRDISGEIMVETVRLNGDSRVSEDDRDLYCKISKPWEGGPLLSVDGNMVGMNLFLTNRRAVFLPWGTTLKHCLRFVQKETALAQSKKLKVHRPGARSIGERSNSHSEEHGDVVNQEQLDLDSMGYPKLPSSMLGAGMILVNSFEEPFGDRHGEGVWRKFSKRASNLNRNVVALASFNGEKRLFACTGIFIEWNGSTMILTSASLVRDSGDENKIDENLRIEVLLNNQCKEGKLEHCNLHYNIALVSVKYHALHPLNTSFDWESSSEVAAVGRCFKAGTLMAISGRLVPWTGTLDCEFLARSTCKITKAGIGGPLVNLDGNAIGMNFYDTRIGTPFLLWEEICKILASFETKSESAGYIGNASSACFWKMPTDVKDKVNRWPVSKPCWCHPDDVESDDDDKLAFNDFGQLQYSYILGRKVKLPVLTIRI
ncbi:unnamed protein product [Urochloa decumbens]|uniref:Uncharacterized protein n=1 Tax=Urochloa decumbens TaxID=240449 RepID=A0ABC9FV74_9POAL